MSWESVRSKPRSRQQQNKVQSSSAASWRGSAATQPSPKHGDSTKAAGQQQSQYSGSDERRRWVPAKDRSDATESAVRESEDHRLFLKQLQELRDYCADTETIERGENPVGRNSAITLCATGVFRRAACAVNTNRPQQAVRMVDEVLSLIACASRNPVYLSHSVLLILARLVLEATAAVIGAKGVSSLDDVDANFLLEIERRSCHHNGTLVDPPACAAEDVALFRSVHLDELLILFLRFLCDDNDFSLLSEEEQQRWYDTQLLSLAAVGFLFQYAYRQTRRFLVLALLVLQQYSTNETLQQQRSIRHNDQSADNVHRMLSVAICTTCRLHREQLKGEVLVELLQWHRHLSAASVTDGAVALWKTLIEEENLTKDTHSLNMFVQLYRKWQQQVVDYLKTYCTVAFLVHMKGVTGDWRQRVVYTSSVMRCLTDVLLTSNCDQQAPQRNETLEWQLSSDSAGMNLEDVRREQALLFAVHYQSLVQTAYVALQRVLPMLPMEQIISSSGSNIGGTRYVPPPQQQPRDTSPVNNLEVDFWEAALLWLAALSGLHAEGFTASWPLFFTDAIGVDKSLDRFYAASVATAANGCDRNVVTTTAAALSAASNRSLLNGSFSSVFTPLIQPHPSAPLRSAALCVLHNMLRKLPLRRWFRLNVLLQDKSSATVPTTSRVVGKRSTAVPPVDVTVRTEQHRIARGNGGVGRKTLLILRKICLVVLSLCSRERECKVIRQVLSLWTLFLDSLPLRKFEECGDVLHKVFVGCDASERSNSQSFEPLAAVISHLVFCAATDAESNLRVGGRLDSSGRAHCAAWMLERCKAPVAILSLAAALHLPVLYQKESQPLLKFAANHCALSVVAEGEVLRSAVCAAVQRYPQLLIHAAVWIDIIIRQLSTDTETASRVFCFRLVASIFGVFDSLLVKPVGDDGCNVDCFSFRKLIPILELTVAACDDMEHLVRLQAASALGALPIQIWSTSDEETCFTRLSVMPAVLHLTSDRIGSVRVSTFKCLGDILNHGSIIFNRQNTQQLLPDVVSALESGLADSKLAARVQAVWALGNLGTILLPMRNASYSFGNSTLQYMMNDELWVRIVETSLKLFGDSEKVLPSAVRCCGIFCGGLRHLQLLCSTSVRSAEEMLIAAAIGSTISHFFRKDQQQPNDGWLWQMAAAEDPYLLELRRDADIVVPQMSQKLTVAICQMFGYVRYTLSLQQQQQQEEGTDEDHGDALDSILCFALFQMHVSFLKHGKLKVQLLAAQQLLAHLSVFASKLQEQHQQHHQRLMIFTQLLCLYECLLQFCSGNNASAPGIAPEAGDVVEDNKEIIALMESRKEQLNRIVLLLLHFTLQQLRTLQELASEVHNNRITELLFYYGDKVVVWLEIQRTPLYKFRCSAEVPRSNDGTIHCGTIGAVWNFQPLNIEDRTAAEVVEVTCYDALALVLAAGGNKHQLPARWQMLLRELSATKVVHTNVSMGIKESDDNQLPSPQHRYSAFDGIDAGPAHLLSLLREEPILERERQGTAEAAAMEVLTANTKSLGYAVQAEDEEEF